MLRQTPILELSSQRPSSVIDKKLPAPAVDPSRSSLYSTVRPALAGLVGGGLSTFLLHPLDLLKTRQAVDNKYMNIGRAVKEILRNEGGVRGLYCGVAANVGVAAASWGIYFMSYGYIKSQMLDRSGSTELAAAHQLAAAFGAGTVTTLLSNPLSVVRTRMVVKRRYASVLQALLSIAKTEGIGGMYKGLKPSLVNVSHGSIQFLVYSELKRRYLESLVDRKRVTLVESLALCSASKLVAAVSTYPCQNLRARQQAQISGEKITVSAILRHEGLRGLYRGMMPYMLHVTPNVCIVFLFYELMAAE